MDEERFLQLERKLKNLQEDFDDFSYQTNRKIGGNGTKEVITQIANGSRLAIGSGNNIFKADEFGIYLGSDTFASAPFRVTPAGALTATSATISGAISASTIDIGGADATSFHIDIDGNIWAGAATYNIATNPFAVSNAGIIRAISGTIGGWTLGATSLISGTGATTVGMDSGGTNPAFYAGSATPGSAPFRVTQGGQLTATDIIATGTINAQAGYLASGVYISTTDTILCESAGLNVGVAGHIRGGQTDYVTGNGFFLGYSGGHYAFSVGEATQYLKYDTTNGLEIKGSSILDAPTYYSLTAGEALTALDSVGMGYAVLANELIPTDDTHVMKNNGDTNYGTETTLQLGGSDSTYKTTSFIKFTLTNLPTTNLISATLYFYAGGTALATTWRKVTGADWAEGTLTWNNQPATGTTVATKTLTINAWNSIDITTQVQNWLNGTDPNYGLEIDIPSDGSVYTFCNSSEAGSNKPYLLLTYDNTKVFKSSANNATNAGKWIGFITQTVAADGTGRVQLNDILTTSGLTASSIYYLANTRGTIATSAGTVTKKVGIALTTTKLFIDRVV